MELKVKREDLLRVLTLVQGVAGRKVTMPILSNILIEAREKRVTVMATDMEVGLSMECPADVLSSGKIAVNARTLFDIAKGLKDGIIHIKLSQGNHLLIEGGRSKFNIVGVDAGDFPILSFSGSGEAFVEDGSILTEMIERTSFAMSNDETRYNLNGVYLHTPAGGKKGLLRMVATDGHRLSYLEREMRGKWGLGDGIIIPRKGVLELSKAVEDGGEVKVSLGDKDISVEKDGMKLVVRLIDGKYPPYEQVIPRSTKRVVNIGREEFIDALKRVSLVADERTKGVKMTFSPKHLEITASNPEMGEAGEELEVGYKGDIFSIGFNARYLIDVLQVMVDERVVIGFNDETNPCVISSEKDKGMVSIIMPMRL